MGFYGPSQLVQDAQRHGVEVLPVDVMHSAWDCTLEHASRGASDGQPAVRLGLCLVAGLNEDSATRIVAARERAPFTSTEDLALRAGLDAATVKALASADALLSLSGHRRQQVWDASALHAAPALLREAPVEEEFLELEAAGEGEEIVFDYAALGLTLRRHPLALLRTQLAARRLQTAQDLRDLPDGKLVRACGLVTTRQQPQTAKGVVFVTLEDETGTLQVIVWKRLREKQRTPLLSARLLAVYGSWQREGDIRHLIAHHLVDMTPLLGRLMTGSRDFR
jgi:error-prone DNA polymerase